VRYIIQRCILVAPHAGAWIETRKQSPFRKAILVAPHAGAWIETLAIGQPIQPILLSPLTRGRGLKLIISSVVFFRNFVAPHAGAWIETNLLRLLWCDHIVAPHAGAWIETFKRYDCLKYCFASPLTRGRGLKPKMRLNETK